MRPRNDARRIATFNLCAALATDPRGGSASPAPRRLVLCRHDALKRRRFAGLVSFLLLVVIPACVAAGYLWLLAADRFESEARFVLRMPGRSLIANQVANLLQTSGVTRANDDGYIVREFLESRDAVSWLQKNAGLRQALSGAGLDPLWRFPNVFTSNTEEGLYDHTQRLISASFDTTTGVSTLKIQAFSPADAQKMATSLLDGAEALINRLNERARQDAIGLPRRRWIA